MLFKIEIPYSNREILEKMDKDAYQSLRKEMDWLPEDQKSFWRMPDDILATVEDIRLLTDAALSPEVKQVKNTYSPTKPDNGWSKNLEKASNSIHVHIPNIGLLMMEKVAVLEDCCTNELQRWLDAGWRILAICPPNGTRRPDYIIGATNKESDL
jgi:hypothetical protein